MVPMIMNPFRYGGGAAASGGWTELGRHTLGAPLDYLEVSSLPDKRYYKMIWHVIDGTASWCQPGFRLGNSTVDTGSNYPERYSRDGASDLTVGNTYHGLWANAASPNTDLFGVSYIANLSANEKLALHHVAGSAAGAGAAPSRLESVGKWVNTSNPLDLVRLEHQATGNGYNTDSECIIMGWDPTDTHTDNFWEELASVDLSGGTSDNLSSGTFTAKRYLWVQAFMEQDTSSITANCNFNNDTGSNYARRRSNDGAADSTDTSASTIDVRGGETKNRFENMFIINNSANEKFVIGEHTVATAGVGTAPNRTEYVAKWANTSSQITEVDFHNVDPGNYGTKSIIKVWGSD